MSTSAVRFTTDAKSLFHHLNVTQTSLPTQWGFTPGVQQQQCESHHLSPPNSQITKAWSLASSPTHLRRVMLRNMENFTFYPHLVKC
jgi:hypothetical protein